MNDKHNICFFFSDIDECAGNHGCDQLCTNLKGSFKCSCEDNYRLDL